MLNEKIYYLRLWNVWVDGTSSHNYNTSGVMLCATGTTRYKRTPVVILQTPRPLFSTARSDDNLIMSSYDPYVVGTIIWYCNTLNHTCIIVILVDEPPSVTGVHFDFELSPWLGDLLVVQFLLFNSRLLYKWRNGLFDMFLFPWSSLESSSTKDDDSELSRLMWGTWICKGKIYELLMVRKKLY